jgi:5'-3' exonuclease
MGVPGFVAWLYRNHKRSNFIFKQLFKSTSCIDFNKSDLNNLDLDQIRIESAQHLLIDTNCLIHPQARQICIDNPNLVESNLELLEKKIIKQIITYIELLIDQTQPTDSIYIAIDGVAPMAKIKHQRLRRFKTVYDRKILESIAKKHSRPISSEWNTSAITPGTIFMDKLTNSLIGWIRNTNFKCKVIFSSSYVPGEGEHKLLQYLKTLDLKESDSTIIYGLDADLLFLALASSKSKLYLMRETSQMEINSLRDSLRAAEGFSYLSIDILRELIIEEMVQRLGSDRLYDSNALVNDFVFMCYFCGNDFIPNIPSISLKPQSNKILSGIEIILNIYTDAMLILNNLLDQPVKYLIDICSNDHNQDQTQQAQIKINYELFVKILDLLSDQEQAYYEDMFKYKRYIRNTNDTDPYMIEKYNYEENIIDKYCDPIRLGDPSKKLNDYKSKYYKHYFNIKIDTSNPDDKSLNNILNSYVQGLIWTTYYYYDKCKDYEWFYDHHHGPFISDLRNFIKSNPQRIKHYEELYGINGVWFQNQIKPLQQLMLVLPHESSFLIPQSYRTLMFGYKLRNYFPLNITNIKMDYLYKNKAWQNIPMINIIDPRLILKLTSKVILKEESERNRTYNDYVKNIKL